MDELGWRVVLLGMGLLAALLWLASALARAPKRRSRWQRLKESQREVTDATSGEPERRAGD